MRWFVGVSSFFFTVMGYGLKKGEDQETKKISKVDSSLPYLDVGEKREEYEEQKRIF